MSNKLFKILRVLGHYVVATLMVVAMSLVLSHIGALDVFDKSHDGSIRPFSIGFILVMTFMTVSSGGAVGLYTLFLSILSTYFYLMAPHSQHTQHVYLQELIELSALIIVGTIVIASIESSRRARDRAAKLLFESEEARARLNAIMDTAPVGVITSTPAGILDYANQESENIWGQPLLRIKTEDWQKYGVHDLDGNLVPPENLGLARALRGEKNYATESIIERPDGSHVRVSSISTPVKDKKGRILGAMTIMSNTTERAKIETERQNALEALKKSEERFRNVVTNAPIIAFSVNRQGIFTFSEGKRLEAIGLQSGEIVGKNVHDVYGDVPEIIENIQKGLAGEITSWTGTVHGVTFVTQCTPTFDAKGETSGLIGVAFDVTEERAVARELEHSEERYRSLVTATAQIVWNTPADGSVVDIPGWREYTGQSIEEVRGWGWLEAVHPEDREHNAALWRDAIETKKPYANEYRIRAKNGEYYYFAARGVPVVESDGTMREWIGVCTDIDARKKAEMERARLLLETQALAERESFINRIGQKQRASENPQDVQRLAVDALGEHLQLDRCYFAAFDTAEGTAEIIYDWHRADLPSMRGIYRLSDFPVNFEQLFASGQTIVNSNLQQDGENAPSENIFRELGLMAAITVPLLEKNKLVGILAVATAEQQREWTSEEINLVEAVAAQTRTAMALAYALQHDHNIAERLQDALKPSLPTDVEGLDLDDYYRSALEEASIGGDFYDVFQVDAGQTALVIGDLSGKGLAAASQIAMVRNMLRYALYRGQDLTIALEELNTVLTQNNLLSGFVTLFVALFDNAAQKITYVSCGHEPMLIRRAQNAEILQLEATGAILGAFPQVTYAAETLSFTAGDALILYTDGFPEAGRSRLDFLGTEGIIALVKTLPMRGINANMIVRRIVEGTEAHTQGNPHDDRALLVAIACSSSHHSTVTAAL